jgi:teichuronic acid exporter
MSLKKRALSSIFWVAFLQISTQIINFLVSLVLTRMLLPEEFGLIAMLGIFIGVGGALAQGGMNSSLIRTTDPDDIDYSTVFFFNLVASCLIYSISYFSARSLSLFYDIPLLEPIVKWYCLVFIFNAFSSIQLTRLQKKMMFRDEMFIKLPSLVLSSIVGIIMAYLGFGVWSLVTSSVLQSLFLAFQIWFISDWRPKFVFDRNKFSFHLSYGYKLTLSSLLEIIFANSYPLIIGKYFSPTQVGFFNRADTLKQIPINNTAFILNKVTFPLFSEIRDDNNQLKLTYQRIIKIVVFIVAPVLLIMAALGEPLFRTLFTEKWLPSVPYFQVLCWTGILFPLHSYNLNVLKVKGRSDLFLKLEVIKKVCFATMLLITVPFGIYQMLIGSLVVSIISFFINSYYTGLFLNYPALKQISDILPIILISIFSSWLVAILDVYLVSIGFPDLFRLFAGTLVGVGFFLIISYAFKLNVLIDILKLIYR